MSLTMMVPMSISVALAEVESGGPSAAPGAEPSYAPDASEGEPHGSPAGGAVLLEERTEVDEQGGVPGADGVTPDVPPRAEARIVGGKDVKISFAPWQVALVSASAPNVWDGQFCGGSILSREWIATAAHCVVFGDGQVMPTSQLRVLAGSATLSRTNGSVASLRTVQEIVVYPDYSTDDVRHDIALVRLSAPLTLRKGSVQTIALPASRASSGTSARITGWGVTWMIDSAFENAYNYYGTPLFPTALQGTTVTVQADSVCRDELSFVGLTDVWDTASMLCAKSPGWMHDTCSGDSGGPLATQTRAGWQLTGITSWGVGCAWFTSGAYVNVANYRTWIEGTILGPGSVPEISTLVRTSNGYRFDVTNHDPRFRYQVAVRSGSGRVRVGRPAPGGLPVTVSGVAPGATVRVEIITTRVDHVTQATSITGAALLAGSRPTTSRPVRSPGGFTFAVTNHNPAYTYDAVITSGVGSVSVGTATGGALPISVTGVAPGRSVTVRVSATREGHVAQSITVRSSAPR
jgi:secreted trypsin-like serine protease/predicted RNA-binding protein with TRAM domain